MLSPRNIKEIQCLTGRIARLNKLISNVREHYLAFFKVIQGAKKFEWMIESEKAFNNLKALLASPPLLQSLKKRENLLLYLSVNEDVISSMFIGEEGKKTIAYLL